MGAGTASDVPDRTIIFSGVRFADFAVDAAPVRGSWYGYITSPTLWRLILTSLEPGHVGEAVEYSVTWVSGDELSLRHWGEEEREGIRFRRRDDGSPVRNIPLSIVGRWERAPATSPDQPQGTGPDELVLDEFGYYGRWPVGTYPDRPDSARSERGRVMSYREFPGLLEFFMVPDHCLTDTSTLGPECDPARPRALQVRLERLEQQHDLECPSAIIIDGTRLVRHR